MKVKVRLSVRSTQPPQGRVGPQRKEFFWPQRGWSLFMLFPPPFWLALPFSHTLACPCLAIQCWLDRVFLSTFYGKHWHISLLAWVKQKSHFLFFPYFNRLWLFMQEWHIFMYPIQVCQVIPHLERDCPAEDRDLIWGYHLDHRHWTSICYQDTWVPGRDEDCEQGWKSNEEKDSQLPVSATTGPLSAVGMRGTVSTPITLTNTTHRTSHVW